MGRWGFKALEEVWPKVCQQRCWFHKMGNVLNKMPKSLQSKAKADLQNIWMAENREEAEKAFALFIEKYEKKIRGRNPVLGKGPG